MRHRRRLTAGAALVLAGVCLLTTAAAARADVQALIDAAFADIARGGAEADNGQRLADYRNAVQRAEEAVRQEDQNAEAHYALFCSLGRVAEMRNPLGRALMLPRLLREIDRTLALAPQHHEALAAKSEMLLRLPRLLGGDVAAAEAYARRAMLADPTYWRAHILLARVLVAENRPAEARAALAELIERVDPQSRERTEALQLLAEMAPPSSEQAHDQMPLG